MSEDFSELLPRRNFGDKVGPFIARIVSSGRVGASSKIVFEIELSRGTDVRHLQFITFAEILAAQLRQQEAYDKIEDFIRTSIKFGHRYLFDEGYAPDLTVDFSRFESYSDDEVFTVYCNVAQCPASADVSLGRLKSGTITIPTCRHETVVTQVFANEVFSERIRQQHRQFTAGPLPR